MRPRELRSGLLALFATLLSVTLAGWDPFADWEAPAIAPTQSSPRPPSPHALPALPPPRMPATLEPLPPLPPRSMPQLPIPLLPPPPLPRPQVPPPQLGPPRLPPLPPTPTLSVPEIAPETALRVPRAPMWRRTATLLGPAPIAVYRHRERDEVRLLALRIHPKEVP
jgi:hypothetical protein